MKETDAAVRTFLMILTWLFSIALFRIDSADSDTVVLFKFVGFLVSLAVIFGLAFYRTPIERAHRKLKKRKLELKLEKAEREAEARSRSTK